jgi:hypothetical protein
MIRYIKSLITGLVVGLAFGLWFGVNIGKDQNLFANPFTDRSIQDKLLDSGGELLEKSGKAIKDKVNSN